MTVEYIHASKFGNGAKVAAAFREELARRGIAVNVHHVKDLKPAEIPGADLYVFSAPGRFGRPIKVVRRFLDGLQLPAGTRCAVLTTEMAPKPDKKTGRMPTEEEFCRFQHVRPIMRERLQARDLVEVAEEVVYVTEMKGPLEDGWEGKVAAFAARIAEEVGTGAARAS